ncbi:MAG: threonine--tRNA ligase, partial [Thermodesulfobacteriota bacterium]
MDEIQIKLPDGEIKAFPKGTTVGAIIKSLGTRETIIGAKLGGKLADFWFEVDSDSTLEPVLLDSPAGLDLIRHTAAHVMAEAVQGLFPGIKVTIGPVIENGFYYDFDFPTGFTPEDLEKIEEKMKEIVKANKPLARKKVSRQDAISIFEKAAETYKVEIINDLPPDEQITIYEQGDWYDLCRGPHAPSTGFVKAFKLLSIAGAYWRGNENNP